MSIRERASRKINDVLQLETTRPAALSRQLRAESGRFLRNRRGVVGLTLLANAALSLIGLYQMGIVKKLPEPLLPRFHARKVDASVEAYRWFATPDAFLGLGSYALTATLAAMGGPDRARQRPWIPLALAAKVGGDALFAGYQLYTQVRTLKAFCVWCLLIEAASFASVPLVLPEAREALRTLKQ